MTDVSVSQNIMNIEENMKKLVEQITLIQLELTRYDGSLRVFKNLQELGIEHIAVPKDVVDNDEVMESLD